MLTANPVALLCVDVTENVTYLEHKKDNREEN